MVFGRFWSFWLCKTTSWTFEINYGQKITNVDELKYPQQEYNITSREIPAYNIYFISINVQFLMELKLILSSEY